MPEANDATPPKLVQRRANRNSSFRSGRTIGEKRERLETANERAAARKKDKRKQTVRIIITIVGFLMLIGILVVISLAFFHEDPTTPQATPEAQVSEATIEIIDEDATSDSRITSRMRTYVAQVEQDFRELGYTPTKAVMPSGSIREVDIYLDGYTGFIKMIVDRGSAVSVEDADRMIRYLAERDIHDFAYIDVRVEGRAFWK